MVCLELRNVDGSVDYQAISNIEAIGCESDVRGSSGEFEGSRILMANRLLETVNSVRMVGTARRNEMVFERVHDLFFFLNTVSHWFIRSHLIDQ